MTDHNKSHYHGPESPPPSYAGDPPHTHQSYQAEPYQNGQASQPVYTQAPEGHSHELPAKAYGSYEQHGEQHTSAHKTDGQGGYPAHLQQPQVVYVQVPAPKKRRRGDDVALGCCGGCLAACCCCGCTIM